MKTVPFFVMSTRAAWKKILQKFANLIKNDLHMNSQQQTNKDTKMISSSEVFYESCLRDNNILRTFLTTLKRKIVS